MLEEGDGAPSGGGGGAHARAGPLHMRSLHGGGAAAGDAGVRRASRVDPLTMAASVALRMERDSEKAGGRRVSAQQAQLPRRMSHAERAAMDADVEGALSALGAGDARRVARGDSGSGALPEEDIPEQRVGGRGVASGGGALLPALPSARQSAVGTAASLSARGGDLPPLSSRD